MLGKATPMGAQIEKSPDRGSSHSLLYPIFIGKLARVLILSTPKKIYYFSCKQRQLKFIPIPKGSKGEISLLKFSSTPHHESSDSISLLYRMYSKDIKTVKLRQNETK